MRLRAYLIAVSSMLLASPPVIAQDRGEAPAMAPLSNWTLSYDEDSCALARTFGDPAAPTLLELRQYAPGAPYFAVILRQAEMRSNPEPTVYFGPVEDVPRTGNAASLETEDFRGIRATVYSVWSAPDSVHLAEQHEERDTAEEAIQWLHVGRAFASDFRLQTGGMNAAFSAMRACQADLLSRWGFDSEEQRNLQTNATVDWDDGWITLAMRNITRRQLRNSQSASHSLLLFSDSEGQVTNCRALSPFEDEPIVTGFCEIAVARGHVTPAINAEGEPTTGVTIFSFILGSGSS
jgi:hypothetical protein